MIRNKFLGALLIAVGVVLAFNLVFRYAHPGLAGLYIHKVEKPGAMDVLFLGNSLVEVGVNVDEFERAWKVSGRSITAVNGGMFASTFVEQYILAKHAYATHHDIKYLIVGFMDHQPTDAPDGSWEHMVGAQEIAYLYDPAIAASLYYPGSTFQRIRYQLIGLLPMFAERATIWSYYKKIRNRLAKLGDVTDSENPETAHAMGDQPRVEVSNWLMRGSEGMVSNRHQLSLPVIRLIEMATQNQTHVVFIRMPATRQHIQMIGGAADYTNYLEDVRRALGEKGVTLVDAGEWISDQNFHDGLHLDQTGANIFSKRLADVIATEN